MSISNSYELFQSGPQINTVVETAENTFYFYQHPLNVFQGGLVDGAARDSGNTTTDVLRPGLLLGKVYSTGKLKEWNPTGTDGTQFIYGILDNPGVKMQANAVNKDRFRGTIMVRGQVNPTRLLIPGQASYGISGNANENIIRGQLKQLGFLLQEDNANSGVLPATGLMDSGMTTIQVHTDNVVPRTLSLYESGGLFTNRGASALVEFKLPTTAPKGVYYTFYGVSAYGFKITALTSGGLVTHNNAAATSVTINTAAQMIGAGLKVVGDGTSWLVIPMTEKSVTLTVA